MRRLDQPRALAGDGLDSLAHRRKFLPGLLGRHFEGIDLPEDVHAFLHMRRNLAAHRLDPRLDLLVELLDPLVRLIEGLPIRAKPYRIRFLNLRDRLAHAALVLQCLGFEIYAGGLLPEPDSLVTRRVALVLDGAAQLCRVADRSSLVGPEDLRGVLGRATIGLGMETVGGDHVVFFGEPYRLRPLGRGRRLLPRRGLEKGFRECLPRLGGRNVFPVQTRRRIDVVAGTDRVGAGRRRLPGGVFRHVNADARRVHGRAGDAGRRCGDVVAGDADHVLLDAVHGLPLNRAQILRPLLVQDLDGDRIALNAERGFADRSRIAGCRGAVERVHLVVGVDVGLVAALDDPVGIDQLLLQLGMLVVDLLQVPVAASVLREGDLRVVHRHRRRRTGLSLDGLPHVLSRRQRQGSGSPRRQQLRLDRARQELGLGTTGGEKLLLRRSREQFRLRRTRRKKLLLRGRGKKFRFRPAGRKRERFGARTRRGSRRSLAVQRARPLRTGTLGSRRGPVRTLTGLTG